MENPMYKVTYAEHATILASLRYLQKSTREKTRRASVVSDIFDGVDPLTDDEIDTLCDKINTMDVLL